MPQLAFYEIFFWHRVIHFHVCPSLWIHGSGFFPVPPWLLVARLHPYRYSWWAQVTCLCATCNFFPTLKSQRQLGGQCYYRDTMESVLIYHKNKQIISLVFWPSLVIHFDQGPLNLRRSSSSPPMHSRFPGGKGSGDNKELEATV